MLMKPPGREKYYIGPKSTEQVISIHRLRPLQTCEVSL